MNCCREKFEKILEEVFILDYRENNGKKLEENYEKLWVDFPLNA